MALLCYSLYWSLLASQFQSDFSPIPALYARSLAFSLTFSSVFHCASNICGWVSVYCIHLRLRIRWEKFLTKYTNKYTRIRDIHLDCMIKISILVICIKHQSNIFRTGGIFSNFGVNFFSSTRWGSITLFWMQLNRLILQISFCAYTITLPA